MSVARHGAGDPAERARADLPAVLVARRRRARGSGWRSRASSRSRSAAGSSSRATPGRGSRFELAAADDAAELIAPLGSARWRSPVAGRPSGRSRARRSSRCGRGSGRRTCSSSPGSLRGEARRRRALGRGGRGLRAPTAPPRAPRTSSTTCAMPATTALHPVKRLRPVASGELRAAVGARARGRARRRRAGGRRAARALVGCCFMVGFLALQAAYTRRSQARRADRRVAIAGLFVVRAAAGARAVDVRISPWLLICTALLALFLALAKRRAELVLVGAEETPGRPVLGGLLARPRRPARRGRRRVDGRSRTRSTPSPRVTRRR